MTNSFTGNSLEINNVELWLKSARPDFLSISALFRKQGWRVLSVEPNPTFAAKHRECGHEIYEFACGEHDADDVEFCVVHTRDDPGITNESFSSLAIKPGYAALKTDLDVERIRVDLRRLDTILEAHAPDVTRVDCLAIDVEGWELEVLKGFDLEKFKPRVIILENLLDSNEYRDWMKARGYRLWKTLFPNEVYVLGSYKGT